MRKKAFTLIELAIVLTITGIVIGSSFQALKSSRAKASLQEQKIELSTSKDAIVGYANKYIDLPTWLEFANTLSPIKGKSSDQNKSIFYFVDYSLDDDIDICTFNTTNTIMKIYSGGTFERDIPNIAFVIATRGANKNMQTNVTTSGGTNTIIYNPSSKLDYNNVDGTNANDKYDDIVEWVTLSELQTAIECSKNKLSILNDSEIVGNNTTSPTPTNIYNPQIFATKGTPFADSDGDGEDDYKWCVEGEDTFNYNVSQTLVSPCTSTDFYQSTSIKISSTNATVGNYKIKVYVKDKSDNNISKDLLIKILP